MFRDRRLRQRRQRRLSNLRRRRGWSKGIVMVALFAMSMTLLVLFGGSFSGGRSLQPSLLLRQQQRLQQRTTNLPWNSNVLHVVMTRFMQDQPDLVWLAKARLFLFQYICLPTMIHQSTQDFIWIIQTDPKLNNDIRSSLVKLLDSYPNYFLLGSNVQLVNIRHDDETTIDNVFQKAPLYTGDVQLLHQVYENRHSVPIVLQTRLDADDGLEMHYLELIQKDAQRKLATTTAAATTTTTTTTTLLNWFFWCNRRHLEWYSDSNRLTPVEHSHLCVTPGLTMGMRKSITVDPTITAGLPQQQRSQHVVPPNYAHDVLFKKLEQTPGQCVGGGGGGDGVDDASDVVCIRMMDELPMGAIRSRTWTSAGMMDIFKDNNNIDNNNNAKKTKAIQEKWWDMLQKFFGIPPTLNIVQDFLKEHMIEIARDNLKGQCTEGHSCKQKSVETLKQLIQQQQQQKKKA